MKHSHCHDLPDEVWLVLDISAVRSSLGTLISCELLSGGLTNRNYLLVGTFGKVVVRVGAQNAGLLSIDRANERVNSMIAAEVGIGAPVLAHVEQPSILAIGYIPGRTLSKDDLQSGIYLESIAKSLRCLHHAPPFASNFNMFQLQARYLQLVRERGFWLPKTYQKYAHAFGLAQTALTAQPETLCPCHNDLLAENFIELDGTVHIIDYEYSGNNEASFELGNIASESDLTTAQVSELCAFYWGTQDEVKIARARLWSTVAKYGWTLWASLQDGEAALEFDFIEWGMEKFDRAVAEFESPEFVQLVRMVQYGAVG